MRLLNVTRWVLDKVAQKCRYNAIVFPQWIVLIVGQKRLKALHLYRLAIFAVRKFIKTTVTLLNGL